MMEDPSAQLKVLLLSEQALVPKRATPESAGYDLHAAESGTLPPGERKKISIGISIEIPAGYYGQINGRSGLALKYGLLTLGGVIDADYRGELFVMLYNSGNAPYRYEIGDRIAQMVVLRMYTDDPVVISEPTKTGRSTGGFGSTGTK